MEKFKWFSIGIIFWFSFNFLTDLIFDHYKDKKQIELQKITIERLNNQLSKMDTLHDECFKMSEIRNAKK